MGKAIDRNGRPLLAPAVKNITDQKQTVGGRGSAEAAPREATVRLRTAGRKFTSRRQPLTRVCSQCLICPVLMSGAQVRSAVTEMLDAWVAVTAASSVMSDVMEVRTWRLPGQAGLPVVRKARAVVKMPCGLVGVHSVKSQGPQQRESPVPYGGSPVGQPSTAPIGY